MANDPQMRVRRPRARPRWHALPAGFVLPALLLVTGCAVRGGHLPYNDGADLRAPDRPSPEDAAYDLPLGPLDVIHVTVFRVPDLSGDYQVDAKGFVRLPLLGAISVRDQRTEQFASTVRDRYAARFLNDPDVTVRVIATNSSNVTVEGGVNQAGIYALPGRTTLLGAIALAHGIDQNNGNPKRVAIFRKQDGHTVAAAFDLVAIGNGKMRDPAVYPGDTIVVQADNLRQLYRDLIQTLPAIAIFGNL